MAQPSNTPKRRQRSPKFAPRLDASGRVDIGALEPTVSDEAMVHWMRARLQGQDPHVYTGGDALQSDVGLFIDLWRRSGSQYPRVGEALRKGLARLLTEAWAENAGGTVLPWHRAAIRLATVTAPPEVSYQLREIAQVIARSPHQPSSTFLLWLEAAAEQRIPSDVQPWLKLLGNPLYSAAAFRALSQNLDLAVTHLPHYWESIPEEERAASLKDALRGLIDQHGESTIERLAHKAPVWSPSLVSSVNAALEDLGRPRIQASSRPTKKPRMSRDAALITESRSTASSKLVQHDEKRERPRRADRNSLISASVS